MLVDAETVTRMVHAYSWLLDHVGAEGIKLTGAGYLPPVHVEAAVAALDLGKEWIGKGNREVQTAPVLHLRETATKMESGTIWGRLRQIVPLAWWASSPWA